MSESGTVLDLPLLELATENVELRLQLAEAQDQLIEMAVDAGELQAELARRGQNEPQVRPSFGPVQSHHRLYEAA